MIARFSKYVLFSLIILVLIPLTSCLPESQNDNFENIKIVEVTVGGEKYFIPEKYFRIRSKTPEDTSIYILTMFPDFLPLSEDPQTLWEKGVWWKKVSVLAQYYPKSTQNDETQAQFLIDFLKAYEVVGTEYGLIHQKQPDGYVQDHADAWIEKENDKTRSIITCTENLGEGSFPQCTQYYYLRPKLMLRVDYDKRMFSEWGKIDVRVRELFESFKSPETARQFIELQHQRQNSGKMQ